MSGTNRQSRLTINLGGEQILLERIEAVEALSQPFAITIDFMSTLTEIDLLPHLGKPAAITVTQDDSDLERHFHGFVAEGEFLTEKTEGFQYRLLLRPFTYFMTFNRQYRLYYQKTAIEIIQEIVAKYGGQVDKRATGSTLKREYCTQYGESDFTFISRLMEEEGIYYFFQHSASGHKMVLCDLPAQHAAGKAPSLEYNSTSASVLHTDNKAAYADAGGTVYLQRWHERVTTGNEVKASLYDWDFEKSSAPLTEIFSAEQRVPPFKAELTEWPGPYIDAGHGKRLAQALVEGRRAEDRLFTGETQLPSIEVGTKITITHHPSARYNQEVMITRTHHVLVTETYRSGSGGEDQGVVFEAIPAATPWRAPPLTPKPVVRGPETAIVIGPDSETIHTDKWGRVQVLFHWDRGGEAIDKRTCWLRVSQSGGLGNIILPRVGHEVLVDFLNGDPDRPLVVGRVFNEQNEPIYKLADEKTKMLWRSKTYTSAGGADDVGAAKKLDTDNPGANEIRMEDMVGKEELFFHAQRDLATRVRRTETHHVGLDQNIDMGGSRDVKIAVADKLDVTKSIKVDAGTTIEVEAKTSIKFTVGQSSILIDQKGITIEAPMVSIEGKTKLDAKSLMTTINGDTTLTLKGGMVMIN